MSVTYLPRTLERFVQRASQQFPVLMVTGPRQVGKTTLLRAVASQDVAGPARRYVSLDDPLLLALARDEPALFLQRFAPPVLIDEIQYAPQLLPLIKALVDQDGRKGLVWLTGSQPFHLMQGVGESLAGRVAVVSLQGLSLGEMLGCPGTGGPFVPRAGAAWQPAPGVPANGLLDWAFQRIWQGGFPSLTVSVEPERDLFYGSYLQTYVQRDVRQLAQVGDLNAFTRFVRSAAARTAQLLNIADMARDVGVAPNTAKHWLSVLQASGLVYLMEPFHNSLSKRLVKTPKLYFLDTGLAAYLTAWSSPVTLEAGAMAGALFETWVVAELLKSWWHHGKQAPLHFYRDKDQKEVDVLIVRDGVVHPIEIKKTAQPSRDMVRHFAALGNLGLPVGHGAVVCLSTQAVPITASVDALPAWAISAGLQG